MLNDGLTYATKLVVLEGTCVAYCLITQQHCCSMAVSIALLIHFTSICQMPTKYLNNCLTLHKLAFLTLLLKLWEEPTVEVKGEFFWVVVELFAVCVIVR